jgi:hypothetical protein
MDVADIVVDDDIDDTCLDVDSTKPWTPKFYISQKVLDTRRVNKVWDYPIKWWNEKHVNYSYV